MPPRTNSCINIGPTVFLPGVRWRSVSWLASIHAGEVMAYPVGDDRFGSILSLSCFIVGVVVLAKRQDRTLLVMVVAPLALAMVAAALRRYPYGGARLSQWYGSLACLMIGLGVASLLAGIAKADVRRRVFQVAVGSLFVLAIATLAKDMAKPYKRLVDFEHRGFVRWFWKENASEGEVVCVHTDLGKNFVSGSAPEDYLCYQRAYSPVHRLGPRAWRSPICRPIARCAACRARWKERLATRRNSARG